MIHDSDERTYCSCHNYLSRNSPMATARECLDICYEGDPKDLVLSGQLGQWQHIQDEWGTGRGRFGLSRKMRE